MRRAGLGRLDRGDRATNTQPVQRYQRDTPGELIHVDVKKIAGIPDGGGWRTRGRGYRGEKATKSHYAGYRYIHTAVNDRTRIVYPEILDDEKAVTAAGFWTRAAAWYQSIGITPQRVLTDNGGYDEFIHFYNHHRSHGSLKWATPIAILNGNLPAEHT